MGCVSVSLYQINLGYFPCSITFLFLNKALNRNLREDKGKNRVNVQLHAGPIISSFYFNSRHYAFVCAVNNVKKIKNRLVVGITHSRLSITVHN